MKKPGQSKAMLRYRASQTGDQRKRTQRHRWDKPPMDEKADEVWRKFEQKDYAERSKQEFGDPGRRVNR